METAAVVEFLLGCCPMQFLGLFLQNYKTEVSFCYNFNSTLVISKVTRWELNCGISTT